MTFGIIANITKKIVIDIVPPLLEWLKEKNIDFYVCSDLKKLDGFPTKNIPFGSSEELSKKCDMVFAFGGDGTFLSVARAVGRTNVPILGVNLGGLGFLAEVRTEELYSAIEKILAGEYDIIERMVIRATLLERPEHQYFALNDVVIDKGGSPRLIQIKTHVDGSFLHTYLADGLIIATPTGSTAYSLSANGPIVIPTMKLFIINPICPHSLTARPLVVPAESVVHTMVETADSKKAHLNIDGQVICALKDGETVEICAADYKVQWVATRYQSFYDVLRTKLNWGEKLRSK